MKQIEIIKYIFFYTSIICVGYTSLRQALYGRAKKASEQ